MQRATVPETCGAAMLVPASLPNRPFGSLPNGPGLASVEVMQTPGAAIVCAWSVGRVAKALNEATVSSTIGGGPEIGQLFLGSRPPGLPSRSVTAVAVKTSSYAAGTPPWKSIGLFP